MPSENAVSFTYYSRRLSLKDSEGRLLTKDEILSALINSFPHCVNEYDPIGAIRIRPSGATLYKVVRTAIGVDIYRQHSTIENFMYDGYIYITIDTPVPSNEASGRTKSSVLSYLGRAVSYLVTKLEDNPACVVTLDPKPWEWIYGAEPV